MANLVITRSCVRHCPYCFASEYMDKADAFMSWDDYIYAVDFLCRSHVDAVSLMGGEPSLHPHFVEFVEYALLRLNHVAVFTSGVAPARTVEALAEVAGHQPYHGRLTLVCNVNEAEITAKGQWARTEYFLEKLGPFVVQSFNIYKPDFELGHLFENIARFNLRKSIRLGLAHPIHGKPTQCLRPDRFTDVVSRIASFLPRFAAMKTTPTFDCGFPMCAFTDEVLGRFVKANATFHWCCAPVVDIGPDLSVWPCFPLSTYNRQSLVDFNSVQETVDHFVRLIQNETQGRVGMYDGCEECPYLGQLCTGGCVANFLPGAGRDAVPATAGTAGDIAPAAVLEQPGTSDVAGPQRMASPGQ